MVPVAAVVAVAAAAAAAAAAVINTKTYQSVVTRILFLVLISATLCLADNQGLAPKSAAAVDSTVKSFMKDHELKGVGLGILSQGRIVYVDGYGAIHRQAPTDLASVSKPLCAILALKLVEEGKLDLDAPVTDYLPELGLSSEVSSRRLLSHTSGLPHYGGKFSGSGFELNAFQSNTLVGQPGASYLYSSPGYYLLSKVLEKAGGAPFLDLINNKVCLPAGAPKVGLQSRYGWRLGAGGLEASPESVTRVMAALMQGRLLSSESTKSMWSIQAKIPGKTEGYGFGFKVNDKGRVSHNGKHSNAQQYNRLVIYPYKGHGMILLVKSSSAFSAGKLTTALYNALKEAGHKF